MDIFNKVTEEMENVGAEVIRVTKDATESAKLHAAIVSEKSKLSEQYRNIGQLLYRLYGEDEEMREILGEDFTKAFDIIDQSKERIMHAKEKLEKRKA